MQPPVIQLVFLGMVLGLFVPMKAASVALTPGRVRPGRLFWLAPLPALGTWQRRRTADAPGVAAVLRRAGGYGALTWVGYGLYWSLLPAQDLPSWLVSYAAALPALFSGLALAPLLRLSFLPLGILLPPFHGNVLGARSLGEFWGRGWNRWMSDWYRDVIFLPHRRNVTRAAFGAFLVSGVVHELVLNVPGYLLLGTHHWGRILGYFLLQWLGLVVERRLPLRRRGARRLFAWIVLLGPAPLLFAEPLLRILFLWPY